jgi:Sulfotransferase family
MIRRVAGRNETPIGKLLSPIFIFGTGRCGSTHLQRLVTLSTRCWIWGEHEGFLEPLLASVDRYETGQRLKRFVFSRAARDEGQLIAEMTTGSDMLSWLNLLDQDEFRAEVVSLIDRMFRSRIPAGWTDWGFKEIRYGLDNNSPEILLNFFPGATGVFTFREPRSTIESMVRTWSPKLMHGTPNIEKLFNIYRSYTIRWQKVMKYFLDCKTSFSQRLVFVSADKLERPTEEILAALELPPARACPTELAMTNRGPRELPEWISSRFDDLFAEEASVCLDLFTRACGRSDADFARHTSGPVCDRPDFG